jgi:hypothetical protein
MGKTFFLKMFAMQKVKSHLKNIKVQNALSCGRILSMDFRTIPQFTCESIVEFITTRFFPHLMIYHLCYLFNGANVDGKNFEGISAVFSVQTFVGKDKKFNDWLNHFRDLQASDVFVEFMRLTNIAFHVNPESPEFHALPVFVFDEVQTLNVQTRIKSKFGHFHSLLSHLLTQIVSFMPGRKPICICAGTYVGSFLKIVDMSSIAPRIMSLTPLVNEYKEYWTENTIHKNSLQKSNPVEQKGDEYLIMALVYTSYQIPRLLSLAHRCWYEIRKAGIVKDRSHILQEFENLAIRYYQEMAHILTDYSVHDISHIILCCGIHQPVKCVTEFVPGTNIQWDSLIEKSIIFPYLDDCYIFPFIIIWSQRHESTKCRKKEIEEYCSRIVKNLKVNDLFFSFDSVCQLDIYDLGIWFEKLFVSSLAVKYYICQKENSTRQKYLPFSTIYDFNMHEKPAKEILESYAMDISDGILYPDQEVFANHSGLPHAVVHNRLHQRAHHDILLPSNNGVIAISVKASFKDSSKSEIREQQKISKKSGMQVVQLIWLYLGDTSQENNQENVAFLNGSGVCNGLSLDLLMLLKRLKSHVRAEEKRKLDGAFFIII